MTKRVDEFLTEAAATFKAKNAEYGDNWSMVGEVMTGLFPTGVTMTTPDDWNRMHILLLKVVKLTRYTVNWDKGGHADSIRDDTVYGAMLEAIDAGIKMRDDKKGKLEAFITHNGEAKIYHLCDTCDRESVCNRAGICQNKARMPMQ